MVHQGKIMSQAMAMASEQGGYASHIGKIGEDAFVYSILPGDSRQLEDSPRRLIVVSETGGASLIEGDSVAETLERTKLREFSTGREMFKHYLTLIKNKSFMIGEGPERAQSIVDAVEKKEVKKVLMYQYLEVASVYGKLVVVRHDGEDGDSAYLELVSSR